MKKKHWIVPLILLASIVAVSVSLSSYFKASKIDAYYFAELSNLYEQQLTTTISSMIPIKLELEKQDEANLDSLNHLMRECQTNLRLTALTAKNFDTVLNRDNKNLVVSMGPIMEHYNNYSELIVNQINYGYNATEFENILQDVRTIKEVHLFSENESSYEDIKQKWSELREALIYEPEFGL